MRAAAATARVSDRIDLVVVSPGTTGGWRRVADELTRALDALDVTYAVATPSYRLTRPIWTWAARRVPAARWPVSDLAQAGAMRRARARAARPVRPAAYFHLSVNSTLLEADEILARSAVWFDTPAALNRGRREGALQRRLEAEKLSTAGLLLPMGTETGDLRRAVLPPGARLLPLPCPVRPAPPDPGRGRVAMLYAPSPEKKGLHHAVRAWADARPAGWSLCVSGIDAATARSFLREHRIDEPPGITWLGPLTPEAHRDLRRRASVVVSASRIEDYGLAQLEALADGAILATLASRGPYEALRLARRLDPATVAEEPGALGGALRHALHLDTEARASYAARAAELMAPYSVESFRTRLRDAVLPELLP